MRETVRVTLVGSGYGHLRMFVISGFTQVSLPKDWLVQVLSDPTLDRASIEAWNPHVLVLIDVAVERLPETVRRGRRGIFSIGEDLSQAGIPSVLLDEQAIGSVAADYLIEKGLENFAVYCQASYLFSRLRACQFRSRVEAAGRSCADFQEWRNSSAVREKFERVPGFLLARHWLLSLPKPVAVYAPADAWAVELINLCRSSALRVPDDITVVGSNNDTAFCERTRPRLSSVTVPFAELGESAGRLVAEMLAGRRPERRVLVPPGPVVSRDSSDIVLSAPPEVRAALAYIADHATQPFSINDLLRIVPTHRRTLEREFRRHLKCSILEKIRRVRIERAKPLLSETRLPLPQVAKQAGFSDIRAMETAFARFLKTTPSGYRRTHLS
ncbi:MAG TPA: substrate-binding domain-containing protein [Tepidisphaeraceae bacterium]|nr:substrate-binding domain-containing protein [Tepidisphaeraceae bacterium]